MMHGQEAGLLVPLRFISVGAATAVLYFGLCYVLQTSQGWSAFSAAAIAYTFCFGIGYVAQRSLVFRSTLKHRVTLARYAVLHGCLALLTSVGTELVSLLFGTNPLFTTIAATLLAGAASFLVSANWVFTTKASR